jgi:hypothetical protein
LDPTLSWVGADYLGIWECEGVFELCKGEMLDGEDGGQVSEIDVYHVELSIVGGFGKGQLYCLCYAKSRFNLPQKVDD